LIWRGDELAEPNIQLPPQEWQPAVAR